MSSNGFMPQAKVLAQYKGNKGLVLNEFLMLAAGRRVCDAIINKRRAASLVHNLNAALNGAGIRQINERDSIKDFMPLMLTIGALDRIRRKGEMLDAFPAASNQLFAYAPKGETFFEANKKDRGKYLVYEVSRKEKYRIELPKTLVDRHGNPLSNKQGALTTQNARNCAISIMLGDISEIGFDPSSDEHVILAKNASNWFAMELPQDASSQPRGRIYAKLKLGKDGVLEGFEWGNGNCFITAAGSWFGVLARGHPILMDFLNGYINASHLPSFQLGGLIDTKSAAKLLA